MVHDMREYPIGSGISKQQMYLTNLRLAAHDENLGLVPNGP